MTTATKPQRVTRQAGFNVDLFTDACIGTMFHAWTIPAGDLVGSFVKLDDERIQIRDNGIPGDALPFACSVYSGPRYRLSVQSIGAPDATTESVLNAKTIEPFGIVRLVGRLHKLYYGPVRQWAGAHWIIYNNRPVEVVRVDGREGATNYGFQER